MQIGGLTKLSIIDFPGKLSLVVYTQGCNRHCGYCHNPQLQKFTIGIVAWEEVIEIIDERKKFIDAVVFSGGEPTLQEDLHEKILDVRDRKLLVGLHTNGDGYSFNNLPSIDYMLLSHKNKRKINKAMTTAVILDIGFVKRINGNFKLFKRRIKNDRL